MAQWLKMFCETEVWWPGSGVVGCCGWEWEHGKERNDGDAVAGRQRLHGGLRNEKLSRPRKIVISLIQVHGNQGRNG
ncbi:hypothetical protein SESBI_24224 [Sesbania bispinosa]|nr:hypothetical protein SESBI_24224 [Sesbania bispinosa]